MVELRGFEPLTFSLRKSLMRARHKAKCLLTRGIIASDVSR